MLLSKSPDSVDEHTRDEENQRRWFSGRRFTAKSFGSLRFEGVTCPSRVESRSPVPEMSVHFGALGERGVREACSMLAQCLPPKHQGYPNFSGGCSLGKLYQHRNEAVHFLFQSLKGLCSFGKIPIARRLFEFPGNAGRCHSG